MNRKRNSDTRISVARIKKVMQSNRDIGKIANNTPPLIGKALEFFVEELVTLSAALVQREVDTAGAVAKITPGHVKEVVETTPKFEFLKQFVANEDPIGTKDSKRKKRGGPGDGSTQKASKKKIKLVNNLN